MAKTRMNSKSKNTKGKSKNKEEKYSAENEIIIGVTTRPKEVRVDKKKSTRTNQEKKNTKGTSRKKKNNNYKKNVNKAKEKLSKEQQIKKSNTKKIVVSLIALLIIVIAGIIYFLTTPNFNIANIEITGNEKISVETYISLSKIDLNSTNMFSVTKNGITKNIKENSYVENVTVKRRLPNTIQINIEERKVAYQAQYSDKYIYIDKQGYVLEINEELKDTIKIIGLESTKEALSEGQRLKTEDLLKLDTILKTINYCKYNSIENKITSINVSDITNYTINFGQDGKVAYLGNNTKLNEKILNLKTVLEKEKGNKGEIFVDEDSINRNRVHFRPASKKE